MKLKHDLIVLPMYISILITPYQKKILLLIILIIFFFGVSINTVTWNNKRLENELQTIPNLSQSTYLNLLNNNKVLFRPQKIISISHNNIWPISGNTTIDLPQSSPFGPRQKASSGYRYDFHRGIDIPADYGTPIHAIADGYVRLVSINETYEQRADGSIVDIYSSTVIQLKHNVSNWPETYYSTYLHVNGTQTQVSAGSFVSKEEVIGFVGDDSTTDFAHLHFEIRYGGLYQYHNVNPWEFLPYINTVSHEVTLIDIAEVNSSYSNITVQLKAQANELDVDEIEITLFDIYENLLENRSLSFNKINRNVTQNYIEILDNNTISKDNYLIVVFPSKFNGYSSNIHWNYTFIDVPVNSDVNTLKIRGLDVHGLESVVEVDTASPSITIISPTNSTYIEDGFWLNFTVDELTTWIGYSLDGTSNVTITGNVSLSSLSEGSHRIVVYARDPAGNEGISATIWFTVDTTSPSITIISPTNSTYTENSFWLNFTVDEPTTWIGYSLDGTSNVTITGNASLSSLSEGSHRIVIYARDYVDNEGIAAIICFTIEATEEIPPQLEVYGLINSTVYSGNILVTVTIIDESALSSALISLTNGYQTKKYLSEANLTLTNVTSSSWTFSTPFDTTQLPNGEYQVLIEVFDVFGNIGQIQYQIFIQNEIVSTSTSIPITTTLSTTPPTSSSANTATATKTSPTWTSILLLVYFTVITLLRKKNIRMSDQLFLLLHPLQLLMQLIQ